MLICTGCSTENNDADRFCFNCGKTLEQPRDPEHPLTESPIADEATLRPKARSIARVIALVLVAGGAGVALTANNALSGVIGTRYTASQLRTAKTAADDAGYRRGYDAGNDAGYHTGYDKGYEVGSSAGYSRGFDRGWDEGCNAVFDKVAESIIAIYFPYNRFSVGSTYYSRWNSC